MGACTFSDIVEGASAQDAFDKAVDQARWEAGNGGYTGTIAEKHEFTLINVPEKYRSPDHDDEAPYRDHALSYAEYLIFVVGDSRVDDKWGPAGCIDLKDGTFLFFGWASS